MGVVDSLQTGSYMLAFISSITAETEEHLEDDGLVTVHVSKTHACCMHDVDMTMMSVRVYIRLHAWVDVY
jgi:hypothetical protein